MASRTGGTRKKWCNGIDRKQVTLRFLTNAGLTPTTIYDPGDVVASVAWTATGTYLITLRDAYRRCLGAKATIQSTSAAATFPQFGDFSNEGTTTAFTAVFRIVNGSGSAADIAANANNSVTIEFEFEDSGALL
jgi:hypothetical protein